MINFIDEFSTGLGVEEIIELFSDVATNWKNLNFNQKTMLFEIAKEIIYSANGEDIFME